MQTLLMHMYVYCLCLYVYVYIYIHILLCILYVCIYIYVHMYMYVYAFLCKFIHTYVCICVYIYKCMCIRVWTYVLCIFVIRDKWDWPLQLVNPRSKRYCIFMLVHLSAVNSFAFFEYRRLSTSGQTAACKKRWKPPWRHTSKDQQRWLRFIVFSVETVRLSTDSTNSTQIDQLPKCSGRVLYYILPSIFRFQNKACESDHNHHTFNIQHLCMLRLSGST